MPQGLFEFFFSFHMYTLSDGKKTKYTEDVYFFGQNLSSPPLPHI